MSSAIAQVYTLASAAAAPGWTSWPGTSATTRRYTCSTSVRPLIRATPSCTTGCSGPLLAADQPQASLALRQALRAIYQHVDDYITRARLGRAT